MLFLLPVHGCVLQAFYKEFDEDKSCIRIGNKKDGKLWVKVCTQCGLCAKACSSRRNKAKRQGCLYDRQRKALYRLWKMRGCLSSGLVIKVEDKPICHKVHCLRNMRKEMSHGNT